MDVNLDQSAIKPLPVTGAERGTVKPSSPSPSGDPAFRTLFDKARARIDELANRFVATTFFYPLLQQVSDSPFKTERFDGGFTERAFRLQLNEQLADRIATGPNVSVGGAVSRQLMDWLKNQPVETVEQIAQEVDTLG